MFEFQIFHESLLILIIFFFAVLGSRNMIKAIEISFFESNNYDYVFVTYDTFKIAKTKNKN